MGLNKYCLGDLLELLENNNSDLQFDASYVRGVNNLKRLMSTKVDISDRDLSKFQIVRPGEFVFNHRTSRNGSKFSIAYNESANPIICTEDYVVFRVRPDCTSVLMAEWLYMYFNLPEFDRYVITNSWGSSTEFYNWEDICSITLDLPDLPTQKKYVAIYKAMQANQQSYERGLEDLKCSFEALVDEQKHHAPKRNMGTILKEIDLRNNDGQISDVQGINITKQFMPSVANITGVDLTKYKIVQKGQFAYSGMQTGRDECIRIALYTGEQPIIISPAYTVMVPADDTVLSEYIMIWFSRKESDRLGWFMSNASIRTNLDLERFFEIEIPVPSLEIQKTIAEIYAVYVNRRNINEKLKARINSICPILIRGSLSDGG